MAVFSIKAEQNQSSSLSYLYEEGKHVVRIDTVEETPTKKGMQGYTFTLSGDFGTDMKRYYFRVYDTYVGRGHLFQLFESVGIDTTRTDIDLEEVVGSYITIDLKRGDDYNDRPNFDVLTIESASAESLEDEVDIDEDW